ncbi:alpha/beta fold hydrolase, partial [Microbacterium testaceum]
GEGHLDDLTERLPHADVHRFEGAGHLIAEERPYADVVLDWLDEKGVATDAAAQGSTAATAPPAAAGHLWDALDARRDDDDTAVIDMTTARDGEPLRVSWRQLSARVDEIAAGLDAFGVRPGDRVSLLVQPGPTLTAALYACLRIGAVVVVADRGLGIRGLSRAVRGAVPDVVIGEIAGLAA